MRHHAVLAHLVRRAAFVGSVSLLFAILAGQQLSASVEPDGGDDGPLSSVRIPRPRNLRDFVRNEQAAIALGKALFWDAQVGGDGLTACASCHASAGTDARTRNTVNPGPNGVFELVPLAGEVGAADFPSSVDDIVGAQGVVDRSFDRIVPNLGQDDGTVTPNATFLDNRQVTGRNTPTIINAIFNFRNFWDGRAMNTFNGRTPGGRDSDERVLKVGSSGSVSRVSIELRDSSLASQSVGPPNNGVEMSWDGRTFFDLGKKMLALKPLGTQEVAADDSVLEALRDPSGTGLSRSYPDLIREAFQERWWNSDAVVDRSMTVLRHGTPNGLDEFTVMEANFSLFWGLAVQMYASTLISDDSPFDRFARGKSSALTSLQKKGLDLFTGEARCDHCHQRGGMFTDAADGDGGQAFANTGVRPAGDDPGIRRGEFKTPSIRNAELTGPYFHNGGKGTLRQVVDFYERGGDFSNNELHDLDLSESEKTALVAFLMSTTDDRVRFQRAPFDHPSLPLQNGPAVPAVGRGGGAEVKPFLDLDPFEAGTSALVVDDSPSKTARELLLMSYPHRGMDFLLFASPAQDGVELPARGLERPRREQLGSLFARRELSLVTTGTLDHLGAAEVQVSGLQQDGTALEFFFVVVSPTTHELVAVSGTTGPEMARQ